MLKPHLALISPLTWEEVYAGWETTDLQYYWRSMVTEVVPRDTSYSERGFAEALSLAREGNSRAILHLKRAMLRDPDSEPGKAAAAVLQDHPID